MIFYSIHHFANLPFRDLVLFVVMGFIGMFINQFAYILGVIYTTPDTATMFQPLVPVVCSIMAVLLRTEKVPKVNTKIGFAKIFGILLAVCGALLMTYGKNNASDVTSNKKVGKPTLFGYICLVVNVSASALYIVIQKKYIFKNTNSIWHNFPIGVTAWTYFFGSVWIGLASFYYVDKPEKFHIDDINVIYALIYAIFITSALCYMLITWTNMQVNSSFVTASWPLQSLFCVILSYFVLGEVLVALEIVGGLLIICALLAVVWSNYKSEINSNKINDTEIRDDETRRNLLRS